MKLFSTADFIAAQSSDCKQSTHSNTDAEAAATFLQLNDKMLCRF